MIIPVVIHFGNTLWRCIIFYGNYLQQKLLNTGIGLLDLPVTAAHSRKHKIDRFAKFQAMNISVK